MKTILTTLSLLLSIYFIKETNSKLKETKNCKVEFADHSIKENIKILLKLNNKESIKSIICTPQGQETQKEQGKITLEGFKALESLEIRNIHASQITIANNNLLKAILIHGVVKNQVEIRSNKKLTKLDLTKLDTKALLILDNVALTELLLPDKAEPLEKLIIKKSNINELNLSILINLKHLEIRNNESLQGILVSENNTIHIHTIEKLDALQSIDYLSKLNKLIKLDISYMNENIKELILPENPTELEELIISETLIKNLSLVKLPKLTNVKIDSNRALESIVFREIENYIKHLAVNDNKLLKLLDLSELLHIESIEIDGNSELNTLLIPKLKTKLSGHIQNNELLEFIYYPNKKEIDQLFIKNNYEDLIILDKVETHPITLKESQKECSLCLKEFTVRENASTLPCSHTFHIKCILNWTSRKIDCPLCRTEVEVYEEWKFFKISKIILESKKKRLRSFK